MSDRQERRQLALDLGALSLLVGLCLLFFWRILTPEPLNRQWLAAGDFSDQFYAFRAFLAHEWWSGRVPLWNPYTFSGSPFLADLQSAAWYPIGLIIALFAGGAGLSIFAVEVEVVIHYCLAASFLYLFVRRLTASRVAGLVGAVSYVFGSYLTSYPKLQMAILEGQTWVPLALLAINLAVEALGQKSRRAGAWLAVAGLALALSALAGHGQTFLLAGYTVMLYMVFSFLPLLRVADGWGRLQLVLRLAIVPLLALGIAAIQLVPSYEYVQLSVRAAMSFDRAGGGFIYGDLAAIILPGLRVIYAGILPLILAILALTLKPRREAAFWGALALLALLLSMGRRTALYTFLYVLAPGWSLFQGQERALQVYSLSLAVLAGLGAAVLARPMTPPVKKRFSAFFKALLVVDVVASVFALLVYWGAVNLARPDAGLNDLLERSVLLLLLLGLSTLALYWRLSRALRSYQVGLLLIPVIVFDLFTLNFGADLQGSEVRDRFVATPAIQTLQQAQGPFRVWDEGKLPGNYGVVWGLEDTGGISPLRLQRYDAFLQAVPREKAQELLNVGYVISSAESVEGAERVSSGPGFYVYRPAFVGQRAWLAYAATVEPDDQRALQLVAQPSFSAVKSVILSSPPSITLQGTGIGRATIVERSPGKLAVDVETDAPAILVLSEIDYPGWRATIDGQPAPVLRAETILRAVAVPAGAHGVEMVFDPASVKLGALITLVSLAVLVALLWRGRTPRIKGESA